MDKKFIWKNPRKVTYCGVDVRIPNYDADFLMHLAHINYETGVITKSEADYINNYLIDYVTLKQCTEQAVKYHWVQTYLNTMDIITNWDTQFPYTLPRSHLIYAVNERGLWKYVLRRLPKALAILVTGDLRKYLEHKDYKASTS